MRGSIRVPVACQMVQAFQTIISRNKYSGEAAILSVTSIHAGEATNVIPETCELAGTVRTFTVEALDMIERRMRQIAEATCQAFLAECEFEFVRYYPPTVNHPAETAFVRDTLIETAGAENVRDCEPIMGAEDFAFFLQQKPGCYFLIGNGEGDHRAAGHGVGPCVVHNPNYDFNDEIIPVGGSMWVRLVQAWLADK